jgi:hypothetical protein
MNTLFTALLLICGIENGSPICRGMANPGLYPTLEICLQSVAEGIATFEVNGFKVARYQCYEWNTGKDLKDLL